MRINAVVVCLCCATACPARPRPRLSCVPSPTRRGFSSPIAFEPDPSDATVQYVAEQRGVIRVIRGGVLQTTPFLDISSLVLCCGERGLLGLAFAPDYAATGRFFVNYTRTGDGRVVVARYGVRQVRSLPKPPGFALVWSTGVVLDSAIPTRITTVGAWRSGPTAILYIAQGDGGGGGDPENLAQNPNELLGKILRVDVAVADTHPQGFCSGAAWQRRAGAPGNLEPGMAQSVEVQLRFACRGAAQGPCSWPTSDREPGKRLTTNPRAVGAAITAGGSRGCACLHRHDHAAAR